jgi:hypothetical protein
MTAIPIEQVGRITSGSDIGQFVLVRNDQERTGGFLIFQSSAPDVFSASEVFDNWVEQLSDLESFFSESGWDVDWQPQVGVPTPHPG